MPPMLVCISPACVNQLYLNSLIQLPSPSSLPSLVLVFLDGSSTSFSSCVLALCM